MADADAPRPPRADADGSARSDRRQASRPDDPQLLGRRAAARARVALPATLEVMGGRLEVMLLNLSSSGAQVEGRDLPGVGNDALLKCGELDALGVVVWNGEGRCGITFDELLDEEVVISLRRGGDDAARRRRT